MRIGQAFPSKYLKAGDLPEGQFIGVTIDRVEMVNVAAEGTPPEEKPVLFFVGKEKGLVLNRTNSSAIEEVYGDETDDWHGQPVKIFATTTSFQGKNVACIRIQVPKRAAAASRTPAAAPARRVVAAAAPVAAAPYAGEDGDAPAPAIDDSDIPF
jgi:hypothetical protein